LSQSYSRCVSKSEISATVNFWELQAFTGDMPLLTSDSHIKIIVQVAAENFDLVDEFIYLASLIWRK